MDKNTSPADIVSADNFEARKLKSFRVYFGAHTYWLFDGWGIFDIAAGGFVSMHEDEGVQVPYCLDRKKIAQKACAEGLHAGYSVIRSDTPR